MSAPDSSLEPPLRLVVVTASDRAAAGVYADRGGDLAEELVVRFFAERGRPATVRRELVPDDRERIRALLAVAVAEGTDLVVTTGGTGIGPRDVTPEATLDVVERRIPGLMEAVRARHRAATPHVDLSRAVAGLAGGTLVLNLPGSPRAVMEFLEVLLPLLPHALEMARGGGHR